MDLLSIDDDATPTPTSTSLQTNNNTAAQPTPAYQGGLLSAEDEAATQNLFKAAVSGEAKSRYSIFRNVIVNVDSVFEFRLFKVLSLSLAQVKSTYVQPET